MRRCAAGLLLGYTTSGPLHHLQMERRRGRDFQVIALTPLSCGELIFSTCSHESDFSALFDRFERVRVRLFAPSLPVPPDTSLEKLGRGVCKGGCSNCVQLGFLSRLNPLTFLLPKSTC